MEAEQMKAGRGNEDAKFLDELEGIEQEVGSAIAPRMGQLVQELAGGALGEAVQRQAAKAADYADRTPQMSAWAP
jgi:hypothetical protein